MGLTQLPLFTFFYILGKFFQDTHSDLEPASRSLILPLLLHFPLWRLLLFLCVNVALVLFLKIASPVIVWNGIWSAVPESEEKQVVHIQPESFLYVFIPLIPGLK